MKKWATRIGTLTVFLGCVMLAACSGGGDSDRYGDPIPIPPDPQVVIDGGNAEAIALGAVRGLVGAEMSALLPPLPLVTIATLAQAVPRPAALPPDTIVDRVSDIEHGDCGGEAPYTTTLFASGAFNSSVTFSGYCNEGMTLSGEMSFSGAVEETANGFNLYVHNGVFSDLLFQEAGGSSFTASGAVSMTFSMDLQEMAFTVSSVFPLLQLTDTATGEESAFKNLAVQVNVGEMTDALVVSGHYRHPGLDFVEIVTDLPLSLGSLEAHPASGTLRFRGAGDSWATFTFTGGGGYHLAVCDGSERDGALVADPPFPPDPFRISYLQYRTFEETQYPYGWIDIHPIDPASIQSVLLRDAGGNVVPATANLWTADYLLYDCRGSSCVQGDPWHDAGFYLNLPPGMAAGSYTFEVVAGSGEVLSRTVGYGGAVAVPPVSAGTLQAQRPDAATVRFSWQNPTAAPGWNRVTELRLELLDAARPGKRMWVKVPPTAQAVTIPASLIGEAGLDPASPTLSWRIQTRTDPDYSGRGYSNSVPLN